MPAWQSRLLLGLGMLGCGIGGYFAGTGESGPSHASVLGAKTAERGAAAQAYQREAEVKAALLLAKERWWRTPRLEQSLWQRVSGFDAGQVRSALSDLRGNEDRPAVEFREMLFFRWGQIDPLAAMEAAGTEDGIDPGKPPPESCGNTCTVLSTWLKDDPQVAMDFVASRPALLKCRGPVGYVVEILLADGAAEALTKAAALSPEILKELVEVTARNAFDDPEVRREYLATLESSGNPQAKEAGWKYLFGNLCSRDGPEKVKAEIEGLNLEAAEAEQLWSAVFNQWIEERSTAVLEWLAERDGLGRDVRQAEALEKWFRWNPGRAMEWLDSHQDTAALCGGVAGLMAKRLADGDPTAGWGKRRAEYFEHFLQHWHHADAPAAEQWVKDHLPEESGIRLNPQPGAER